MRQLRRICLAYPAASERETWGHPNFRVKEKMFVIVGRTDDGQTTVTMKAPPGEQELLLATGHPFFMPPYVGSKGWIGVHLDGETDWDEIAELIDDSYRTVAPKSLATRVDEAAAGAD